MPPPIPSMPYAPKSLYTPRYADNIAQLLTRQGDIQALGAARSGEIWGNFARDIGQIGGQAVQAYGEHKALQQEKELQSKRDAALSAFVDSGIWAQDPKAAIAGSVKILGPQAGVKFAEGLIGAAGLNKGEDPMKALPMIARGLLAAPDSAKPGLYTRARELLIQAKVGKPEDWPEQFSADMLPTISAIAGQDQQAAPGFTLGAGQVRYDASGKQIAAGPEKIEGPDTRSIEVQLADAAARGDQEAYSRLLKVKREATAAGRAPAAPPAPPAEMTFNPEGVVLSSYGIRQKAEVRKQAMERGLPVFETAASQAKGTVLAGIVADAKELNDLMALPEVKDAVGPVAGRWTQLKGNITSLDPDVRRALQLMNSLSDTELRKRSGAQINDKEMQRLLKFTTDPNKPLDHNTVAVAGLLKSAARDYKALSSVDLGTNEEPPDAR